MKQTNTNNAINLPDYSKNSPIWDRISNLDSGQMIINTSHRNENYELKKGFRIDRLQQIHGNTESKYKSEQLIKDMIFHDSSVIVPKDFFKEAFAAFCKEKKWDFNNSSKEFNLHWDKDSALFFDLQTKVNYVIAPDGSRYKTIDDIFKKDPDFYFKTLEERENSFFSYFLNGTPITKHDYESLHTFADNFKRWMKGFCSSFLSSFNSHVNDLIGILNPKKFSWEKVSADDKFEILRYLVSAIDLPEDDPKYEQQLYYYLAHIKFIANNEKSLMRGFPDCSDFLKTDFEKNVSETICNFAKQYGAKNWEVWVEQVFKPKLNRIKDFATTRLTDKTLIKVYDELWEKYSNYTPLFETKEKYTPQRAEYEFNELQKNKQLGKFKIPKNKRF